MGLGSGELFMGEGDRATAILLFAHGSSVEEANSAIHDLAAQIESLGSYGYVRAAFLDLARPDLSEAIALAAQAGLKRVIVVPYFLTMGIHLQRDLPRLIAVQRQKHPDITIEVTASLDRHPLMALIIHQRIQDLLETNPTTR
jgi:sirohydrochlorin ferrochelatase